MSLLVLIGRFTMLSPIALKRAPLRFIESFLPNIVYGDLSCPDCRNLDRIVIRGDKAHEFYVY